MKGKFSKSSPKLRVDPIGHFLIPTARKLDEKEKKELLDKLGKSENELPKILKSDPVVLALGAKEGEIIEFKRNDFGIRYKYYRVVIGERYELPNE